MPTLLQLSSAHRSSQDRVRNALAKLLVDAYLRSISPGISRDIAGEWVASMLPLVLAYRQRSVGLAATFYDRERALSYPGEPKIERSGVEPLVAAQVATSLSVTGLVGLAQKLDAGMPPAEALQKAAEAASGAAGRHALNGGREYIKNATLRDSLAVGYFRQTRDGCCSFCAMLASRGAVFKGDSFNDSDPRFIENPNTPSDVKVHDHCACSYVAVFKRGEAVPVLNETFRTLWDNSTKGYSGNDALNAFRRAYGQAFPDALR